MYKTRFMAIFIGVTVLVTGLVFFLFSKDSVVPTPLNLVGKLEEYKPEQKDTTTSSETKTKDFSGYKTYQNSVYKFSLKYPEKFGVAEFSEGGGAHTVLFQEQGGGGGFQIFISEFDESGPITSGRIKKDIPDMVIENPQSVILGGRTSAGGSTSQKLETLIFFSPDSSLSKTREVWFIWPESPQPNGNYLYQITSRAEFDAELSKIMATFRFN